MPSLTLDRLRHDGQEFMEEVSCEGYLAHSGQKPNAEFQAIYKKYDHVLGRDALELTLGLFKSSKKGSEEHRSAALLLEWQVESQAGKVLAPLDEKEIAWESSATVTADDGRKIPYQAVPIEISNTKDRKERTALDAARAKVVQKDHAPIRLEKLQREKDYIESLGVASNYNATYEELTGISLSGLAQQCSNFLKETQAMWDEVLAEFLKKELSITSAEAVRSDASVLLRAAQFDQWFPANQMEHNIRKQVMEMGVDPLANGRIVLDTGEREGKRARAFCSPVRVPDEVYLVLRPHGGQSDYSTFLHELGHAMHFGYVNPDYPFEFKWLGDNSVTESYAMLYDHRMQDRGWLLRYTELSKNNIDTFLRVSAFEELHFLRRYCAKLIYEVQAYGGEVPWEKLPDLYVDTLSSAVTFRYNPADAFVDFDPRYYSTRYLRAWQLQAIVNEALTEKFDADWWRNPQAGPWIVRELFSHGQRENAEEIAKRVGVNPSAGGGGLSFAPLIKQVEMLLAS